MPNIFRKNFGIILHQQYSKVISTNYILREGFEILSDLGWGWFRLPHNLHNHGELGSLLGLLQLLLSLSELGQVKSSNLLSLFNLLLVSLDLHLQLASQLRHTVLILPVLSLSKSKFLCLALCSLESLGSLSRARLCDASSASSSRIFISSLAIAALPPFIAADSASARRPSSSPSWFERELLEEPMDVTWSCSARSSSARRAASTMAFLDFSSAFLAAISMPSTSACMVWMLDSS